MGSLIQELKRRNVFRVGAAYAVVAWILIQVSETLLPALQMPQWTISFVVVLLMLGFPITLIMAWAFDITPMGLKADVDGQSSDNKPHHSDFRLTNAMLGLLLLAVGFLVVDQYLLESTPAQVRNSNNTLSLAGPINSDFTSMPPLRATIELHPDAPLVVGGPPPLVGFQSTSIALSPDGRYLAYVGEIAEGVQQLFLRDLARGGFEPLAGTEEAIFPFFSPNSQWLGFLTDESVMKVAVTGGAPVTLANAASPTYATWLADDKIYVATNSGFNLSQTSAIGGTLEPIVVNQGYQSPISSVLPSGLQMLRNTLTNSASWDYSELSLFDSAQLESKVLPFSGYGARYLPSGHLIYGNGGDLYAVSFDSQSLSVTGEPQRIVSNVAMESLFGQIQVAVSDNGLLAYVEGGDSTLARLHWIDREGEIETVPVEIGLYNHAVLSPDDLQLALHVVDIEDYVAIYDFDTRRTRKLPISGAVGKPQWSFDGSRLRVSRPGFGPDRFGEVDLLGDQTFEQHSLPFRDATYEFWSRNDQILVKRNGGIWTQKSATAEMELFIDDPTADFARASASSRWVVYTSHRTGRAEIRIRSYPDGLVDRQISERGGIEPVWCRECDEVFFRNGNQWFAIEINQEPELSIGPTRLIWDVPGFVDTQGLSYDISRDGQRLLVLRSVNEPTRTKLRLVTNWFSELD